MTMVSYILISRKLKYIITNSKEFVFHVVFDPLLLKEIMDIIASYEFRSSYYEEFQCITSIYRR